MLGKIEGIFNFVSGYRLPYILQELPKLSEAINVVYLILT